MNISSTPATPATPVSPSPSPLFGANVLIGVGAVSTAVTHGCHLYALRPHTPEPTKLALRVVGLLTAGAGVITNMVANAMYLTSSDARPDQRFGVGMTVPFEAGLDMCMMFEHGRYLFGRHADNRARREEQQGRHRDGDRNRVIEEEEMPQFEFENPEFDLGDEGNPPFTGDPVRILHTPPYDGGPVRVQEPAEPVQGPGPDPDPVQGQGPGPETYAEVEARLEQQLRATQGELDELDELERGRGEILI